MIATKAEIMLYFFGLKRYWISVKIQVCEKEFKKSEKNGTAALYQR